MTTKKRRPSNRPSNPADLLQRIGKEFLDLQWNSYQFITEGWDHEAIILDNKIVFRFPNDAEYVASLRTEVAVLQQLAPAVKRNVPRYVYVAKDYRSAGYPIVPGAFLSKTLMDDMTIARRRNVAHQLAETLTAIHAFTQRGYDLDAVPSSYMYHEQSFIVAPYKNASGSKSSASRSSSVPLLSVMTLSGAL